MSVMQNRLASAGPEDLHERPVQVRATVAVDVDVHNATLHKTPRPGWPGVLSRATLAAGLA